MNKLIIFGVGKIAEAVSYFFNRDSGYEISAYVVDDLFFNKQVFLGKPVFPLSKFDDNFKPSEYKIFVAVGYQGMNQMRSQKVQLFREKGFTFANYRSPLVVGNYTLGDNSIVMDGAIIQPCVVFGNNVFVWGGAMVGHHAKIEDNCWLTGGCSVGGISVIGESTFVGLGAIIGNEIVIGKKSMLGAGTLICREITDGTVLVAQNTEPHRLNSDQFTRMSTCFRT